MRRNSPSFPPAARTRRPLVLALALVLQWAAVPAALAAPPLVPPGDSAATAAWPRVFYTPAERAEIEQARHRPPEGADAAAPAETADGAPPPPPTLRLQGTAQGRRGATAWINGQMLQQGETFAGRTVLVRPDGSVHLRQPGEPDIVLRPGQEADGAGGTLQDVLPPGSVLKNSSKKGPQRLSSKREQL